ncbi:hypothetical protein N7532_004315 [Penicillium argentinense]|uniref:F-box domain-containing protein n=1 Tax=Penicillium argentinense TaxID=1131581 RepID=A0A9W9KFD8_9EURO|nr:uncharacterized protein N7532_004315 [Penicillium argentinense]KAJ5103786.1 hypothetical protein N7532_004315 [Penicillium argentinense]
MEVQPASPSPSNGSALPVELLVLIAEFVYWCGQGSVNWHLDRQVAMHNFCLVGKLWYSAGIELLYRSPQLARGNKFSLFASTVSPRITANKQKLNLGHLVKELLLHELVHQSSPSQLARLLKATSKRLVILRAPRVSFAVNCLPALSKSRSLRYLDLTLVIERSITFPKLKKAISGLPELKYISLPSFMELTNTGAGELQWPQSLRHMSIGGFAGYNDTTAMQSFPWPNNLESLGIFAHHGLNEISLHDTLANPQICQGLRQLHIDFNGDLLLSEGGGLSRIIASMEKLYYLKLPGDMFIEICMPYLDTESLIYPRLRVIAVTAPSSGQSSGHRDIPELVLLALQGRLRNLWSLNVDPGFMLQLESSQQIDDELWLRVPDDDDAEFNDEEEPPEDALYCEYGLNTI